MLVRLMWNLSFSYTNLTWPSVVYNGASSGLFMHAHMFLEERMCPLNSANEKMFEKKMNDLINSLSKE
jgi:hypothetical protein